ncbi:peroxiredoxin-like family protein [soil metagenome]
MIRSVSIMGLGVMVACSKPSGDAPASNASIAPPASASATAAPNMKELKATAADHLGTLAPNTGIPVGAKIPDAHALDLDGKDVGLSSLAATKGPLLLVFYRGGWCPFCNTQIHDLATAYPEYQKRGVTPVAISVDKPEAEAKLKATYAIPFSVLSDSSAAVIEAFHVVKTLNDDELAKMKGFGVDLESYSGKAHHKIAIPAAFLVDRTGTVRWAHADPDYMTRPTTAQLLSAIDSAKLP